MKKRILLLAVSVGIIVVVLGIGMNLDRILGREVLSGSEAAVPFAREEVVPVMAQGVEAWVATNQEELQKISDTIEMPAPVVDFEKSIVLAIKTNEANANKSLRIDRIDQKGTEVKVKVIMVTPLANQTPVSSDLIIIAKKDLKKTGVLTFTFIDQNGKELARAQSLVK